MIPPTHISSTSASIVVDIDDLSAQDLRELLGLKLAEPERLRALADESLRRRLWQLVHKMPRRLSAQVAEVLSDANPRVVLAEYFPPLLRAAVGLAKAQEMGYWTNTSASVAA
jgi:hypothetical protein